MKSLSVCVCILFLHLAGSATAAEYSAIGKIQKIFILDKGAYGADSSHITIAGLISAGGCPTQDGLVALHLRDDEGGRKQLAVALAAQMNSLQVTVRVDDQLKSSGGRCYLKYLELNTP